MFLTALALAAQAAGPFDPPPAPMRVTVSRDAMTDRATAMAILQDRDAKLEIMCDPHRYDGYRVRFSSNRWLVRNDFFQGERPIRYRFDDQRPVRHMWVTDRRSATLYSRSRSAWIVHPLHTAERLVFRTRDVEDHRYDVQFRIVGGAEAMRELEAACAATAPARRNRDRAQPATPSEPEAASETRE